MEDLGVPKNVAAQLVAKFDEGVFAKFFVPFALKFRPEVQRGIDELVAKVVLAPSYASVHIRRGDKLASEMKPTVARFWEGERQKNRGVDESKFLWQTFAYVPLYAYLEQVAAVQKMLGSKLTDVFIATDDYTTVQQELESFPVVLPDYKYLFNENMKLSGANAHIGDASAHRKYDMFLNFMADVILLAKAEVFVGSMDSNVDRLTQSYRFAYGFQSDSFASMSTEHPWRLN
jgi:hypothetical protein